MTRVSLTEQLQKEMAAHQLDNDHARLDLKYAKEDAERAIAKLNKEVCQHKDAPLPSSPSALLRTHCNAYPWT